ncbi:MAG: hypothetical protein AAFP80_12755, partial [Pseudomonadota bacterium]
DQITYTFRVENTGNVTLSGVTVTDDDAVMSGGPILSLAPGAVDTTTFTAVHVITQADIDAGTFSNQATASGTPPGGGAPVTDLSDDPTDPTSDDDPTVITLPPSASIAVEKVADTSGLSSPVQVGDQITYTFRVENTGNVTLSGVTVTDDDAVMSGGPILSLAPGAVDTSTFTAVHVITQADIDAGTFANQATATGTPPGGGAPVTDRSDDPTDPTSDDDPTISVIPMVHAIELDKRLASVDQLFPFVYEITFEIDVTNIGNTTESGIRVVDDLGHAMAPAQVADIPTIAVSGFSGMPAVNPAYDGVSTIGLLVGNPTLAPTQTGTITISFLVDMSDGYTTQGNTAFGTTDDISTPVESDAPAVTPGDNADTNPTPPPVTDLDGDGSPDASESGTSDRDGDGVPDAADYDPTGYFYCEENGSILSGGLITVTGPIGSQTGIGANANITIVRDGADGSFQWFVSAPGRYTMSYNLPSSGVASATRLPAGALDLTSLLPSNPAVLGGGEVGTTGVLSDFSAVGNPFHVEFDIEAGDPTLFNNNIPMRFCSVPELTASKAVLGTPTLTATGSTLVTFRLEMENTGTTPVNNVAFYDDLDAAFGADSYVVLSNQVTAGPSGFVANSSFDGAANPNLIATGQTLQNGESVVVELTLEITPGSTGTFTNTVTASGQSPLDGSPIADATADADVSLTAPSDLSGLVATKTTSIRSARIGDLIPYTITITNNDVRDRLDVTLVDLIPVGFTYRPNTATIDGTAIEPTRVGRQLQWPDQDIGAGATITLSLTLGVGAGATQSEFVNTAWVVDPRTGATISNRATVVVRREIEHVFDCGEIIGKVFDDKNQDGNQDEGERGLPGVRLATVNGLLITTDEQGRYSVPCAAIPDADIGSNFIMKLDARTLPTGYRVTTENPRVVRLTRGKLTKLNFGATISRVVKMNLSAKAFHPGSVEPRDGVDRFIDQLVGQLMDRQSVLRLTYQAASDDRLGKKRLRQMEAIIRKKWARRGDYKLLIERRFVTGD